MSDGSKVIVEAVVLGQSRLQRGEGSWLVRSPVRMVLLHEEREERLFGLWGEALCCLIEEDEGKTTGLRGYGNDRDGWRRNGGSVASCGPGDWSGGEDMFVVD